MDIKVIGLGSEGTGVAIAAIATDMLFTVTPKSAPAIPVKNDQGEPREYLMWGDNNMFPQDLYEDIRTSDLIRPILDWKERAMYAGGIMYGLERTEGNKVILEPMVIPEIDNWLEDTNIEGYIEEATHDFYTYANFYPKLTKNIAGNKVALLYCEDATHVRLGKQNTKGMITTAYVSANWDRSMEPQIKYPVIDRYYNAFEQLSKASGAVMYPIYKRTDGNVAYAEPAWLGIKLSSWLELSKRIPQFKTALMNNSISIKWHIEIHEDYWLNKYAGWNTAAKYSDAQKQQIITQEISAFLKTMGGTEAAGRAFMSTIKKPTNPEADHYSLWKITPLNSKEDKAAYIEDSQEADFHIVRAFGVHPGLIGIGPGKGHSAGSGSSERVAFNQYILMCEPHQRKILEPLNLIARYNGWRDKYSAENARFKFWFNNFFVATLDYGKEMKAKGE